MGITPDVLSAATKCRPEIAARYCIPLNSAMAEFGISNRMMIAHFIAQCAHESQGFSRMRENMNYSAQGLLSVFGRYFDATTAQQYARYPEKIGNRVYANRGGNGDEASGDGYKYRGGCPIQITFQRGYWACGSALGIDLVSDPDRIADQLTACRAAAWWWSSHGCNELADNGDVDGISDVINLGHHTPKIGDAIGYADRLSLTQNALAIIKG